MFPSFFHFPIIVHDTFVLFTKTENVCFGMYMYLCFNFRLLGEVDAFDLGHTFDPKTFGIWMGTKILVGKDKNGKEQAVLLLDTEGIGKDYQ